MKYLTSVSVVKKGLARALTSAMISYQKKRNSFYPDKGLVACLAMNH